MGGCARYVVALAADADDQSLVPQGCQRVCGRAVRYAVFLGEAEDGRHTADKLASGNLRAQEIGKLLMQRDR